MNSDLVKIKKYYGEKMMHLCRELFASILEKEGLLFYLIDSKFGRSRFLYEDIINTNSKNKFQSFIYGLINIKTYEVITDKTPEELLSEVGYQLYKCDTSDDIQKFKKYYTPDEELCTFRDEYRLKSDYVFFAVKDNAASIHPSSFHKERQDEYGTSVISIQFSKGKTNHLSIKNRYNHSVENPDATFNNNLENIVPGLTYSFEKKYNLSIQSNKDNFELKSYYQANGGKFYKYNMEINNIYYCPNNIIIDNGEIINTYKDKARYIFIDYFIIDMKEKNIFCYDKKMDDCFLKHYNKFKKLEIHKTLNGKDLKIFFADKIVNMCIDKQGCITYFEDEKIEEIGDGLLKYNIKMSDIELNNVRKIGDYFLYENMNLKRAGFNNVREIKNYFMYKNNSLTRILLPNVKILGNYFMYNNERLSYIDISKVVTIGSKALLSNQYLKILYMPKVQKIGDYFAYHNVCLENIYAPLLEIVGDYFLNSNDAITNLSLDNLKIMGKYFMKLNTCLEKASFASLISVDIGLFTINEILSSLYVPKLEHIGRSFLFQNRNLESLYLFSVKTIDSDFLYNNKKLKIFVAPNLEEVKDSFLYWNEDMKYLCLEKLNVTGKNFMHSTECLEEFIAPNLISIGGLSLQFDNALKHIKVSENFEECGNLVLDIHEQRDEIVEMIMIGGVWCAKGHSLCKR